MRVLADLSFRLFRSSVSSSSAIGLLVMSIVGLMAVPMSFAGATAPVLEIAAPKKAAVGKPITLTLVVRDAVDLAGFETSLLFDTSVAHFAALQQRNFSDVKKQKRGIAPLGAVETDRGVAFGFYSCPTEDCVRRRGSKSANGGSGRVRLAQITMVAERPGLIQFALASAKFVDAKGGLVAVSIPQPMIEVEVGGRRELPLVPAPAAPWSLASTPPVTGQADVTGDGIVSHADTAAVAFEWTLSREAAQPCTISDIKLDINGDGCIDVADIQQIATNYTLTAEAASGKGIGLAAPEQQAGGQSFSVNSTADDDDAQPNSICASSTGACTLRAAITEANLIPGPNTITFNIPGSGVQTIRLTKRLPHLQDETGPTTIDGYTQPGESPNSDPLVSNAQIRVQLEANTDFDAIAITSANNIVRGLAIFKLKRSLLFFGQGARNNQIVGNFIGTNAAGIYTPPTFFTNASGIVLSQGASANRIGGVAPGDRNVVSGNAQNGIVAYDETTDHNVIVNNLIGLSPSGTSRVRNISHGIDINSHVSYTIIGGLDPGERNVISGNGGEGAEISHGTLTVENQIIGNFIGTEPTGTLATSYSSNGQNGIHIEDGVSNNLIEGNVIGNAGSVCCNKGGISVEGSYIMAQGIRTHSQASER